jgi:signal transduction histidine kinase
MAASVEQLMHSLRIERALECVRAAVFRMEKSSDIAGIARIVWEELQRLGYDLPRCGISIFDEERDFYGGYHVWNFPRIPFSKGTVMENLGVYTNAIEGSLRPGGPFRNDLIAAWRKGKTYCRVVTDFLEKKALAEYSKRVNDETLVMNPEDIPDAYYVYVPFEFGVIGVMSLNLDPEQFSAEDEKLFGRFGEAFADGYRRFLEMRDREIQQSVDHLKAKVASMRQSGDIVDVIVELGQQLRNLGLTFDTCFISIIDEDADVVRGYGVSPESLTKDPRMHVTVIDRPDLHRLLELKQPVLVNSIANGLDFAYFVEPIATSLVRDERKKKPRIVRRTPEMVEALKPFFQRRWNIEEYPAEFITKSVIRVPFSQGSIAVSDFKEGAFTLRDVNIVTAFAEALSLGFTRLHDFQQLEQRNRQLEMERAVEHLRAEVASMRRSADIVGVITELGQRLDSLGVEFDNCTISVIDKMAKSVRMYTVGHAGMTTYVRGVMEEQDRDRSVLDHLWEIEEPVFVRNIAKGFDFGYTVESFEESPVSKDKGTTPRVVHRSRKEAEALVDIYRRRWGSNKFTPDLIGRSLILVPFSHGRISVANLKPDLYESKDVDLVAAFADALSLGFTRFFDFQNLERRNRELEIERSVEKVQLSVQAMKSSADIVRVIPLIAEELWHVGLDFEDLSIRIYDPPAGKVHVYVSGRAQQRMWQEINPESRPFGPETIDILEKEDIPIIITGIPQSEGQVVVHMSAPMDSYYGDQPSERTVLISRSDDELASIIPVYEKYWGFKPWPRSMYIRSIARTCFNGGTIALNDNRANYFTLREARTLERYADAFALGYARYQDFRRLEEQNQALEAASRLKSDFLANMSHEIRTPMNAVINFSSLILEGTYGEISADLRDAVEEIDRNGEALLNLINDLLDLSKIEAGAMRIHLEECSPEECIDTAIEALDYKAREKGLAVIREIEGDLGVMIADQRRITQQVLQNILKNAIKFTAEGEIRIGARRDRESILFWVVDTGIGIPKQEHERVFESFRQVDGSVNRKAEGTGLGLTIARRFVEMHGGRIWLESKPGQGARFQFTIPVSHGGTKKDDDRKAHLAH